MKTYILDTELRAGFDNIEDATAYSERLKEDEGYATVSEPRRNPHTGLYIVLLTKSETVQTTSL